MSKYKSLEHVNLIAVLLLTHHVENAMGREGGSQTGKGGTQTAETTLPSRQRGRKGRLLGGEPGLSGGEGMETRQGRGI